MSSTDERPPVSEYAPFYQSYIAALPVGDILTLMSEQAALLETLPANVNAALETFAYAPQKWTVRQVVGHLGDAERIFGYRAFRFAHADPTPLAGFDENAYVANATSAGRPLADLIAELGALRQANLAFFATLDEPRWQRQGVANGYVASVRALAHILVGHAAHHLGVLRDRYGVGA
jgi:hypothetical protein